MVTHFVVAHPGQTVTLAVQVIDNNGDRVSDGYVPIIASVHYPDLSESSLYPQDMDTLATGLYVHQFEIPNSSTILGTFLISVYYPHPDTGASIWELFEIHVALPFGNSSVSPL